MGPMTRNPAVLMGAALLFVAAGFGLGLLIGQRRPIEDGRLPFPTRPAALTGEGGSDRSLAPSPIIASPSDEEVKKLREKIIDLETRLHAVRDEPSKNTTPEALAGAAKDAYEDMLALQSGNLQSPERFRSLIASLSRIDPALARSFIDQYRKFQTSGAGVTEKFVAIQLALMSGGPEAAGFIQQVLTDPSLDPALRSKVLLELSPTGASFFSIKRLPVDDSLGSTAMTMVRSTVAEDRRAGAGLLGGVSTPASRGELVRLLEDSDASVQQAAIRSLGLVGDATSRKLLEPYAAQTANPWLQKAAAAALKDLDQAPR